MGKVIDEDTGEEPQCVICGSAEGEGCGHLVACIDHTFGEFSAGALGNRVHEFRAEIETAFLRSLRSETKAPWQDGALAELWAEAQAGYKAEYDDLQLDDYAFSRFMVDLMQSAGAIDYPGVAVTDEGPGMSSSISLLYGDAPKAIVDVALKDLKSTLSKRS